MKSWGCRMHLKRLLAPKFWKVERKKTTWVVSPSPGPHPKFECIPLLVIIRDILKLAETGKEAKKIIKRGDVLVDGRPRRDHAFPAGLMDVVSIPKIGKSFRIVPSKKGLEIVEVKDGGVKICRINGKSCVKGEIFQLHLHDGRNILTREKIFKTGDSLLIEIPSQKILRHLKLEEGSLVIVIRGRNRGKVGRVKRIVRRESMTERNKVWCEIGDEEKEVLLDYVMVVGKEKPMVEGIKWEGEK